MKTKNTIASMQSLAHNKVTKQTSITSNQIANAFNTPSIYRKRTRLEFARENTQTQQWTETIESKTLGEFTLYPVIQPNENATIFMKEQEKIEALYCTIDYKSNGDEASKAIITHNLGIGKGYTVEQRQAILEYATLTGFIASLE
jgi:hypothetical protein